MTQTPIAEMQPAVFEQHLNLGERGALRIRALFAASALMVGSFLGLSIANNGESDQASIGRGLSETTELPATAKCPDTWEMEELVHNDGAQIIADGVPEIREAETEKDARKAMNKVMN